MTWLEPALAIGFAVVFALLLVSLFDWRHPARDAANASFLFLVLLLFPVFWLLLVWLAPAGPTVGGHSLLPVIFGGLLLALVIAVLATPRRKTASAKAAEADAAAKIFGVLFLIYLVVAAIGIVAAYVMGDDAPETELMEEPRMVEPSDELEPLPQPGESS